MYSQIAASSSTLSALHTHSGRQSTVRSSRRPQTCHQQRSTRAALPDTAAKAGDPASESGTATATTCRTCGLDLSKAPRGCDQEGHVRKGLGALPGFGWFSFLKVYGPCPELAKNGIAYTRKGQSLDEILFGGEKK